VRPASPPLRAASSLAHRPTPQSQPFNAHTSDQNQSHSKSVRYRSSGGRQALA
jgi:hypothetical protein